MKCGATLFEIVLEVNSEKACIPKVNLYLGRYSFGLDLCFVLTISVMYLLKCVCFHARVGVWQAEYEYRIETIP